MGADDIFDILLLMLVLAIFTPIMLTNAIPLFKGDIGGFDTLVEKTAQKTDEEIIPVEKSIKKEDLLLMTAIADTTTRQPAFLQLSIDKNNDGIVTDSIVVANDELSDEITINEIINQKAKVLSIINTYIVFDDDELEFRTLVGANGIEKWVVFKK